MVRPHTFVVLPIPFSAPQATTENFLQEMKVIDLVQLTVIKAHILNSVKLFYQVPCLMDKFAILKLQVPKITCVSKE